MSELAPKLVILGIGAVCCARGNYEVQILGCGWMCATLLGIVVDQLSRKMSGHV